MFKKLFGSEENRDILLSLINAILPQDQSVKNIILKNTYNVSDYFDGKFSILGIKAEGEDSRLFDIEMQIRGSKFYGKRTLFYWAKIFGSQLDYVLEEDLDMDQHQEFGYSDLKKCIVISLMDFNFFKDQKYHRAYTLKDRETNEWNQDLDYLDLYFIEMKKFKEEIKEMKSLLDRWISFLNNSHKYDSKHLPKELAEIKEIRKASHQLDIMYLDEKEKSYYESQQKFWLDQNSYLKEQIAQAKALAKEEVASEIREELRIDMAKAAIREGLDNQMISKLTALSAAAIEKLRSLG